MHGEQIEMLKQIQALEFTATDFHLYLDTHPQDWRALADYSATVKELETIKHTYAQCYGTLTPSESPDLSNWNWVREPWPWEIVY